MMITKKFILENKDKWEECKKEMNKLDNSILRDLIVEDPDIINIIDLDRLDEWGIPWVLKHHPRLIKDLIPYLYKLGEGEISWILKHQPKLIKEFKPYLDRLARGLVLYVLTHQPKLIKEFKPYLYKLTGEYIQRILCYQPKLIHYFKPYLDKLNERDISYVLIHQSKLIKDLKLYLHKLTEGEISGILEKRPELSLFFKYVDTEYEDAAYYYTCPSEIFKLDEKEKQELSKKMVELLRKEKMAPQ